MAIKMNENQGNAPSSLEDSAYEVLGGASSDEDDCDGTTVSLTSGDGSAPDDIASNADTEISFGTHPGTSSDDGLEAEESSQPQHDYTGTLGNDPTDSEVTARPSTSSYVVDVKRAVNELPERSMILSEILSSFDGSNMPESLRHFNAERINLVMTQTEFNSPEEFDGPFRVLYVGSQWAKEDILGKLASALSRSAAPLRLIVNEVISARITVEGGISLTVDEQRVIEALSDRTILQKGEGERPRTIPKNRNLPIHLAVAFAGNDTDMATSERIINTAEAMADHGVPLLYIAEEPFRSLTLHYNAPGYGEFHLILEDCGAGGAEKRRFGFDGREIRVVLQRLPLDLRSFLGLNDHILNRNLACVTSINKVAPKSEHSPQTWGKLIQLISPIKRVLQTAKYQELKKQVRDIYVEATQKSRVAQSGLLIALVLGVLLLSFSSRQSWRASDMEQTNAASHISISSCQVSSQVDFKHLPSVSIPSATSNGGIGKTLAVETGKAPFVTGDSPSLSSAVAKFANSLSLISTNRDVSVLPTKEQAAKVPANTSNKFEISIIGSGHILVIAPQKLASAKKPPQLSAQVGTSERVMNVNATKITDGVYAIVVPSELRYEPFNLTIWTKSKPVLKQTVELQLDSAAKTLLRDTTAIILHSAKVQSERAKEMLAYLQENAGPAMSSLRLSSHNFYDAAMVEVKQGLRAGALRATQLSKQTSMASKTFLGQLRQQRGSTSNELVKQSRAISKGVKHYVRDLTTAFRTFDDKLETAENTVAKHVSRIYVKAMAAEAEIVEYIRKTPALRPSSILAKARDRALALSKLLSEKGAKKRGEKAGNRKVDGLLESVKKGMKNGRRRVKQGRKSR